MAATTGYKIGFEGSDITLAAQPETDWGVSPDGGGGPWASKRLSAFSTGYTRTRARPNEIRSDKQQPKGVTTAIACSPSISAPMTKTAWSGMLAASINSEFAAGTATNGTQFNSFTLLQLMSPTLSRIMTGCWPSGGSLQVQQGQMLGLNFDVLAKGLATGAAPIDPVDPVNTFDVMDPIASVTSLTWNSSELAAVTALNLTWTKQDAAALYVIGSADAAGIAMGALSVTATATLYFNDLSFFDAMVGETEAPLVLSLRDGADGYDFTLPSTTITKHDDPVNGPGPFTASVEFEAAPGPGGFTMQIDEVSA